MRRWDSRLRSEPRTREVSGLDNNGTASDDSELKTAGFAGGHQDLLAGAREDGHCLLERAGS